MKEKIMKLFSSETQRFLVSKKNQIKSFMHDSPYPKEYKSLKKIFIFGTPTHGNLGDHAIVKAQVTFLKNHYPNYSIIEIPTENVFLKVHYVKKMLNSEDLIFLHGGGNLGDLYLMEEIARREVINTLKKFPIIQFPQSAATTFGNKAEQETKISKKIYSINGKNLTIIARESKSLKKFKKVFKVNEILYTPDIVLILNERRNVEQCKGILLCLRSDSEKVISQEDQRLMIVALRKKYDDVKLTDTIVNYRIFENTRDLELEKKWDEYRNAKVVITDRLHGMIFAVLTGTPCIVFDNYNSKVQNTYKDWLNDYENIRFINVLNDFDPKHIINIIEEIKNGFVPSFDTNNKYSSLLKEINKNILRSKK